MSGTTEETSLARDQFACRVVENTLLCRDHYRLVLETRWFPATEPGQFVQVCCREPGLLGSNAEIEWGEGRLPELRGVELGSPRALLRRPFSLAGRVDRPGGGVELHLIHRVVGTGTAWLSGLRAGDLVDVLGPLGNRFALPAEGAAALLVGGGVGIPPMLYLAEKLAGRRAVAFAGALTRDLLPLTIGAGSSPSGGGGADAVDPRLNVAEFARHGIPAVLTTDDGSTGFRGFVTQALEHYLDDAGFRRQDAAPAAHFSSQTQSPKPVIYTCGPEAMMKRVADIAAARGLECQVAVERAMACGMGTCQSCCIRVRKPDPAAVPLPGKDWCWRLACTDGPVFRGADLLW